MIESGNKWWMILAAGFLLPIAAGCSGWKVATASSDELPRYTIRSIALVPFTAITTPQVRDRGDVFSSTPESLRRVDGSMAVPSGVQQPPRQAAAIPAHAPELITKLFWKRLQSREGVQVLPLVDSVKASAAEGALSTGRPEAAAASVAKKLKADAALMGLVSTYQERVGSQLGADPPASVGFEVKVVAADGRVLWVGQYYER